MTISVNNLKWIVGAFLAFKVFPALAEEDFKYRGHWIGMKSLETVQKFLKDESGQTTTEYILILAVIVTIFMQFRKRLLSIITKLFKGLDSATDQAMEFQGESGN